MNQAVMVIDDDAQFSEQIAQLLEDEGYAPICCADGAIALDQLRTGPAPALILLDLAMPNMDGWQFRKEQRADPLLKEIPVVAMTALRRLDGISVDGVMFKPLNSDQLLYLVRRHCRRQAH